MTTKVSISVGGTGSNSATSTLTALGAVAKTGDTMTGQLNISSGGLNISSGGLLVTGNVNMDSGTLFVDSVANEIGIGTTNPTSNLHVVGTANVSANLRVGDGSSSAASIRSANNANTGFYFPANNEVGVTVNGTVAAAFNSNGVFFRNRIINGDMRIDQRNAGAAVTLNNTAAYTVDRWYDRCVGGAGTAVMTVQQSTTAPTGYTNSKLTTITTSKSPAASEQYWFFQAVEGLNIADFNLGSASALTFTLSFWVRASVTGTYSVAFQNSAQNRSYVATYTVNAANTYEQKTITVAGDTSGTWLTTNGVGMYVFFDTGSGSNFNTTAGAWGAGTYYRTSGSVSLIANSGATLYITGVQLETGSVSTPFERRPFGTELMLCQRYCYSAKDDGDGNSVFGTGMAFSGTNAGVGIVFPVTMRASPSTLTTAGSFSVWSASGSALSVTSISLNAVSNQTIGWTSPAVASGLVAGNATALYAASTTAQLIFSAEL